MPWSFYFLIRVLHLGIFCTSRHVVHAEMEEVGLAAAAISEGRARPSPVVPLPPQRAESAAHVQTRATLWLRARSLRAAAFGQAGAVQSCC